MLTNEQVEMNKERFISLVQSIQRPNFNKEGLIKKLLESDWFTAPASAKYHCSYRGGLVEHSLHVYDNLCKLVAMNDLNYDGDSLLLVALFHDLSKMNFYIMGIKNKKIYSPEGKKWDEMGNFDWVSVPSYEIKPIEERFIYGNHEETSEFMLHKYCPLTVEESVAILNHHAGMGWDSSQSNISDIYNRYTLAVLLHLADMMSCYVQERI